MTVTVGKAQTTTALSASPNPSVYGGSVTLTATITATTGTATVTVAGKAYDAKVGATFGQDYLIYSVFNSSCVRVLVGDQSLAVCSTKPVTFTR